MDIIQTFLLTKKDLLSILNFSDIPINDKSLDFLLTSYLRKELNIDKSHKIHALKTHKEYFIDVVFGSKLFELQKDDRDYKCGDLLLLKCTDELGKLCIRTKSNANANHYSFLLVKVGYILKDAENFGLSDGYCIMGIKDFYQINLLLPVDKDDDDDDLI